MFHDGDLQSGIASAIQQQKYVACFVREDNDEASQLWEEVWLLDQSIADAIKSKTVLLRITNGSPEAGFLAAFCPISESPLLIVIHNGTVLETLDGGIEHDEWKSRLLKALGAGSDDRAAPSSAENTINQSGSTIPQSPPHNQDVPTSTGTVDSRQDAGSSGNVQTLLAERARRLEAERLRREGQEKAERLARAKSREEDLRETAKSTDKGKGRADGPSAEQSKARADWIKQQAHRKEEAKKERDRILAQIENDKQERRDRERLRKEAVVESEPLPGASTLNPSSKPASSVCALQIRLFDGSSIKGRFAPDSSLSTSVRPWIKETSPPGGADIPYNFRQILAPNPSRSIEVGEEAKSLADLDLTPSATLVLVPVADYTEAYETAGSGLAGQVINSAMGMVSGAFSLVGGAVSYVKGYGSSGQGERSGLYMGGTADEQEPSNVAGAQMAGADSGTAEGGAGRIRMKTLADQRAEAAAKDKRTEFYNGNSLGFEGKKDEDEAKK